MATNEPASSRADTESSSRHISALIRGSSLAFLLRILGAAMALGIQIVIARFTGDTAYGDYSYALAIVGVLALLARVGFGTSLIRFIGQYKAEQDPGRMSGVLVFSLSAVLVAGCTLAVIGSWAAVHASHSLSSGQISTLRAAAWLLPPLAVLGVLQAILIGFKRIGPAIAAEQIVRPLLLAGTIFAGIGWYGWQSSARNIVTMDAAVVAISALVLAGIGFHVVRREMGLTPPQFDTRTWFVVSLPLLLMTGLQVLFNQTDIIMLGSFGSAQETGLYAAAARVARLVLFGLTAVNAIAAPMIAESFHANRINDMADVLRLAAKLLIIFTVGMIIAFIIAGRFVLGLFGAEFVAALGPMYILVAGQAVNSLSGPVAYMLTMTGHQNLAARIVGVCVLLNIVLNAVLIPMYGMWGAAVATAVSIAAWNIWLLVAVKVQIGINPSAFRRW